MWWGCNIEEVWRKKPRQTGVVVLWGKIAAHMLPAPFLSFGGRSLGPGFNSPSSAKRSRPACTFLNKKFRLAYCCTAYQETLMLHPRTRSCLCVRKNPSRVRYRCASGALLPPLCLPVLCLRRSRPLCRKFKAVPLCPGSCAQ